MAPTLQALGNDIFQIEGLLEPSLCQHVIQVAECSTFEPAKVALQHLEGHQADHEILYLSEDNSLLRSTNQLLLPKLGIVQQLLLRQYGVSFPHVESCTISRFYPGQAHKLHIDNLLLTSRLLEMAQGALTRDVAVIGYLNEDFAGGEILFNRQNLKVKPATGTVIVFPACYTHPNQSLPVSRGKKYMLTTWLLH